MLGNQKFDENKIPIEANFTNINGTEVMVIPKSPLNFSLPTYTKGRKVEFTIKMYQYEHKQ
jgi:hypothetical protein